MSELHIQKHDHYWQNKIAAFLNESPIKVFDIKKRDEIAKDIRNSFSGMSFTEDRDMVSLADHIASGLTRAVLPSDDSALKEIILKHPLVKGKSLSFFIEGIDVQKLKTEIKALLETDLEYLTKETSSEEKARQVFNYLFFALSKRLRNTHDGEICKLGALWDILPADTRMPDHPMWHHFGLTSAVYSSLEANQDNGKDKENLSLVVYSITPVQEFIGKARKLRDYWTGSVLLSYLAFVGITKVCEEVGPDHVLYPSLQNQALMEQWLSLKDSELGKFLKEENKTLEKLHEESKGIASFPNKFVFLCSDFQVKELCAIIKEAIDAEWKSTAKIVKDYIVKKADAASSPEYNAIWEKSLDHYWKYSWAATGFATIHNEDELKKLLPENKWKKELDTMRAFEKTAKQNGELVTNYDVSNLYGTTHSLVQGLLAAGKTKPILENVRHSQNGEKCPLCGENEVLNTFSATKGYKAKDYSENIKSFWDKLREKENGGGENSTQIGKNERLCAVCALKRFLPVALKDKNHLLYPTLVETYKKSNFPSTTEMSAYEYLQTVPAEKRKEIAQNLHEHEFDTDDDYLKSAFKKANGFETKYYAFLLMDGDKMGDLINGETTEANWNDVLNLGDKSSPVFDEDIEELSETKNIERKKLGEVKRTINPALHSMISDSLNNFARYGVQPLVNASGGRLIYAGGDDVCAILPLSTAFETADKIRKVYQLSYGEVTENGSVELKEPNPNLSKIVMHLGHSDNQDKTKISLSGAIIIAHHKQPLKEIIQDAHKVLDGVAKEKSGRNSLAIRLKKRSGGDRDVWFKWEEKNVFADGEKTCRESFLDVISNAGEKLTPSLLYKIENLKGSFEPILFDIKNGKSEQKNIGESEKKMIVDLFNYEVAHSIYSRKDDASKAEELAKDLAGLCIKVKNEDGKITAAENWFNPESAIIANFMAKGGVQNGKAESEIGGEK